jgi:uncharacterized protein (UPF0333 family)
MVMNLEINYCNYKCFKNKFIGRKLIEKKYIEKKFKTISFDNKGQAGAEMILLIGGMIVIVLIAVYFYKNYLLSIGDEMNSTELSKLNQSIKNISSRFN